MGKYLTKIGDHEVEFTISEVSVYPNEDFDNQMCIEAKISSQFGGLSILEWLDDTYGEVEEIDSNIRINLLDELNFIITGCQSGIKIDLEDIYNALNFEIQLLKQGE